MTDCSSGDVVIVPFPFTDLRTTKRRPALVLARVQSPALPALVVLAMITSQIEAEVLVGDYLLKAWKDAGLLHPSRVRLAKMVSLEARMILQKLGSLGQADRRGARRELRKVFADWIHA